MQNKENFTRNVGDTIEKVGQKISDAGATKAGNAVYNTGDRIEHSEDQKKDLGGNVVDRKS